MKKWTLFLPVLMVIACNRPSDPLFGTWHATKVNVGFDEKLSTPDMVKQIGEMEKQNQLDIKSDSTMTFVSGSYTLTGQLKLLPDGTLLCDGELFGTLNEDRITTKNPSPFGEIQVEYTKK